MKNRVQIVLAGIVFAAAVIVAGTGNAKDYRLEVGARNGEYSMPGDPHSQERQVGAGVFRIQINSEPEFQKGSRRVPFLVVNPEENQRDLQVSVRLDETGELLYRSEVLHPGEREAYGEISVELETGEYAATAVFEMLDRESGEAIGQVEAGVFITCR